MHQPQAFPDYRIARARQPTPLLLGQSDYVTPQRVNEQRLRELRKHGFTAYASRNRFFDQVQNGTLQPLPGSIHPDVDLKDRWQTVQYRPANVGVTSHVSTNETRSLAAAAGVQRAQIARPDLVIDPIVREWRLRSLTAHIMRIPIRENDDVSGVELERLPVGHVDNSTALDHQMVKQEMSPSGSQRVRQVFGSRGGESPRGREFSGEEDGAV